jgi:uncharacterized protein YbjT (DUF2867 family)
MILITGATGNIGRELVRLLAERGAPFRALVRDRVRATALLGATVPLVEGDLARPETLDAALDGVDRVFLLSSNAPDQVELQGNMVRAAQRAHVAHLVKLSGLRPAPDPARIVDSWHHLTEVEIRQSGLPFTFLQPGFFAQDLFLYAEPIRRDRILPTPTSGAIAFVDTRDIAAVAAAVLTERGHEGRTYPLTGPSALTFGDAARALSEVLGHPVTHQRITYEEAASGLRSAGLPDWLGAYVLALYRSFDEGAGAEVTAHVAQITGRPARAFEDFARDHASLFQRGGDDR